MRFLSMGSQSSRAPSRTCSYKTSLRVVDMPRLSRFYAGWDSPWRRGAALILAGSAWLAGAAFLRPSFLDDLPAPADGKCFRGDALGDARRSADVRIFPDAYRRNQRGVGADEGAVVDDGGMFLHAVVVTRDGA